MFINCYDRLHCMLAKAIAYVHGTIDSKSDWDNFEQAIMCEDYSKKISSLNNIKGIRAVSAIDISIDEEFLSGDRWFTETVQANKSCAVLYSSDLDKAVLVIFYDKECDFFIVDYIELEEVPDGAILRDPLTSLTQCIVYKEALLSKYDKAIIIQGKGEF